MGFNSRNTSRFISVARDDEKDKQKGDTDEDGNKAIELGLSLGKLDRAQGFKISD